MSQQILAGLGAAKKDFIEATYSGHDNDYLSGDYRIVVWTGPGWFTVQNAGDGGNTPGAPYMDVALVGGGGTGSERHGPGAPSGGMVIATDYNANAQAYPISIGGDRPGNRNSTQYTPGHASSAFGFTAVGGGSNQTGQPNPGNAGGYSQWGPGAPAGGPGDQGGGGAGTGGGGQPGGGNVGYGGEGRMIPFSPGHYGYPGGYFAAGGAGGGRGGSNAPRQNVGGGGGNPNDPGQAHGSAGGGGRDQRTTTGTGKGGICIVKYKYQ